MINLIFQLNKQIRFNYVFISLYFLPQVSTTQSYNVNWIIGFGGNSTIDSIRFSGLMQISFIPDFTVQYPLKNNPICNPGFCPSAISDKYGNLLFYSDAFHIYNREHVIAKNGERINPGGFWDGYLGGFYPIQNSTLFIPQPDNDRYYFLFHKGLNLFKHDPDREAPYGCDKFYYTLLDLNGDNGLGEAIKKNSVLLEGEINSANMSACKHANGRDWWLVQKWSGRNEYNFFFLTANGVAFHHRQTIGPNGTKSDWNGRDFFSEQGDKYIQVNHEDHIIIMDFDRCSGEFFNPIQIKNQAAIRDSHPSVCAAMSASGRFLYFCNLTKIWQYDLQDNDISSSAQLIAEYDGGLYDNFWRTNFYNMRLAPDNTIYICTFGGNNVYLHRILFPERFGKECKVVQRSIILPAEMAGSLPLMPNYSLGPVLGSECDSIYNLLSVDLFHVTPNLFRDQITITCLKIFDFDFPILLNLISVDGRSVESEKRTYSQLPFSLSLAHLNSGLYFYEIQSYSKVLDSGKLIKH